MTFEGLLVAGLPRAKAGRHRLAQRPGQNGAAAGLHVRLDAVDGQPVLVRERDVAPGRARGERAEGQAVDHEGRALAAALLDLHRRRDRQRDDPAAPGLLGHGDAEDAPGLVVGAPQLELDEVAPLRLDARHQHGGRALGGELERRRVRREHRPPRRGVPLRLDPCGQRLRGERREVAAPAVQRRDRIRVEAEHRDPGPAACLAGVAREPQHGLDLHVVAERCELLGRGGLPDPDEAREVLPQREVERHREGGLLLLPAGEGRPVALREDGEPDADQQEGGRDGGVARMPGEGERCEAEGGRAASRQPLQEQERGAQQPRADDRRDEGDEAGQEDERHRRPRLGRERLLVEVAPEQRQDDDGEGPQRRGVDGRERPASQGERPRPQGGEEDERESGRHRGRGEEPGAGERGVREDLADRRSGPGGDGRAGKRAEGPAGRRSGNGDGRGLRAGVERELPAARPEPGEAPPRRLGVAPHAHGGEDGEGEEQGRGLAAHEQEPPRGHVARFGGCAQLLDRSRELERARRRLQGRPGARDVAGQLVDLPGPHRSRLQRRHPGVAAVHVLERRRGRQLVDPLGEDERRRLGPVVAGPLPEARAEGGTAALVLGRHDEVAEEHRRGEDGRPDLDEAQPLDVRDRPAAAQPDDLAALGLAGAREAAGAERHPPVEPVDRAEAEERARDRALPEEDERGRLAGNDPRERLRGRLLEAGVVLVERRQAEPRGPHGALLGRESPRPRGRRSRRGRRRFPRGPSPAWRLPAATPAAARSAVGARRAILAAASRSG